jgi:hypothetical protein
MTPVDAVNTRLGRMSRASHTASTERSTAASPALPVKALALPALTMKQDGPLAAPPCASRFSRQSSTGAAAVREVVNTPATAAPGASSASMTSVRPVV